MESRTARLFALLGNSLASRRAAVQMAREQLIEALGDRMCGCGNGPTPEAERELALARRRETTARLRLEHLVSIMVRSNLDEMQQHA